MRRLCDYKAYILDMDGTLYYKYPMRLSMAFLLGSYYLFHLKRRKELLLLRDYRRLREKEEILSKPDYEEKIRQTLSVWYGYEVQKVDEVIETWMHRKPLKVLYRCRDRKLSGLVKEWRKQGKKVYIYSDYPAEGKREALRLLTDACYSPDGENIIFLKPDPSGLQYILEKNDLSKDETIIIGDRYSKDGRCAEAAGVDFLILKGTAFERRFQYRKEGL